jgi:hypothetical protein
VKKKLDRKPVWLGETASGTELTPSYLRTLLFLMSEAQPKHALVNPHPKIWNQMQKFMRLRA